MKINHLKNSNNNNKIRKDVTLFIDLDGVLFDFVRGIKTIVPDYDEKRYKSDSRYRRKMWDAVIRYSEKGGKLWFDLPLMDDAKELWDYVKQFDHEILTATGKTETNAGQQKRDSVKKHFGDGVKINLVKQAKEKATFAKEGDILIDDQPKAINPWKAAGGTGILHISAKKTIKKLKELGY